MSFVVVEKVEAFTLVIRKARGSHVRCLCLKRKERVTPFARLQMPPSEVGKNVNTRSEGIVQAEVV